MKKVQTRDELLSVLKSCREGLSERFGVMDLAIFGSYAKGATEAAKRHRYSRGT